MLQRIQTVFLFMIVILMTVFQFFPVWVYILQDGSEMYRLYGLYFYSLIPENQEVVEYWPYAIAGALALLGTIVALIEAFSYNKRLTQLKLGALNSLLLGGSLIAAIWFTTDIQKMWAESNPGQYGMGLFMPAIALLCNLLANRFIRKDEKLVRSMDRIR